MKGFHRFALLALALTAVGASPGPSWQVTLSVTSSAFPAASMIPSDYTCDGANRSPPIAWTWVPDDTRSIAIIIDDVSGSSASSSRWLVWNVSPTRHEVEAGSAGGGVQGTNDVGRVGYEGPCPPHGRQHDYELRVYALDTMLSLEPTATQAALGRAMSSHVVAGGWMLASYRR